MPNIACAIISGYRLRQRRNTKHATMPHTSVIGTRIGLGACASAKIVAAATAAHSRRGSNRRKRNRKYPCNRNCCTNDHTVYPPNASNQCANPCGACNVCRRTAATTVAAQKTPAAATTHNEATNPPRRNPIAAQPGNDHHVEAAIQATDAHHSQDCCGRGVQMVAMISV